MNLNVFFLVKFPHLATKERAVNPIKVFLWGKNGAKVFIFGEKTKGRNRQI